MDLKIIRLDSDSNGWRFYQGIDEKGNIKFTFPSVTTILDGAVPKDGYLIKWIREQGIGGQAIFEKAAEDGTEVHEAIDQLLHGGVVSSENMNDKVKKGIQAFIDWHEEFKPKMISSEQMVYNMDERYAGGCDFYCELDYGKYKGRYVIDWKTSNSIQDKHKYQIAAYQRCVDPEAKVAIVHLGNRTKAGYSFKEFDVDEAWGFFKQFNKTFQMLNPDAKPKVVEYPSIFTLQSTPETGKDL